MQLPQSLRRGRTHRPASLQARRRLSRRHALAFLSILGPGLVSAIAGDDAGGIATYATVGAKYGYELLWALLIVVAAMVVIQEMTARLAVVTGKGLSDLIREEFGVKITTFAMLALLISNATVTITEFVGIAAASELFGVSRFITVPIAAVAVWWIVVRGNYSLAERVFLILSFVLGVYVISAIVVSPDWGHVIQGTFIPTIRPDREFILLAIAVIGTTISPYMQFTLSATTVDRGTQVSQYNLVFWETVLGAVLSGAFAFFIVIATAATLNVNGVTNIETAAQAALALEPIAGPLAEILFGIGLLGASLLAASILPLSTTYAITEAFGFERGVNQQLGDAPVFYGLYTALIVIGASIALIPNIPFFLISVLIYALNGILLPVQLVLMLRLANNPRLMGSHANSPFVNAVTWGTTIVLVILTALLLGSQFVRG